MVPCRTCRCRSTPTSCRCSVTGSGTTLRRVGGAVGRLPGEVVSTALDPIGTTRQSARMAGSLARMLRPVSEPLSPIMGGRSLSVRFDTLTSSLPDLKAAAKAVDGTLNDAFVAAVAGGLKRYHDKHGAEVEQLRMTMPINTRPDPDEVVAGNQFVPARFAFPVSIADPAERVRAMHDLLRGQRDEPALGALGPVSTVLNQLPLGLSTAALGSMLKGIDVVTSNVPGAPIPIYAGRALDGGQLRVRPVDRCGLQHHAAELPRRGAPRHQHRPGGGSRSRGVRRLPAGRRRRDPRPRPVAAPGSGRRICGYRPAWSERGEGRCGCDGCWSGAQWHWG